MKKLFFVALTLVMGSFSSQANVSTLISAEKPEWVIIVDNNGNVRGIFNNGCPTRMSVVNIETGSITNFGTPC